MVTRKIGKWPEQGDKYGYFPDVFSVSVNRELSRCRQKGTMIDNELVKGVCDHASEAKIRFIRRYGECE